jgi:hypothetical protein
VAQQRGELVLLELEQKMLKAVDKAWTNYEAEGGMGVVPTKLVALLVEAHKAVMQRMNAKYGLDGSVTDLETVLLALRKEEELVQQMIDQRKLEMQ